MIEEKKVYTVSDDMGNSIEISNEDDYIILNDIESTITGYIKIPLSLIEHTYLAINNLTIKEAGE